MDNKEQVYSQDCGTYGSYEDLMNDLREYFNVGESVEIWEADKIEWNHSDFIDVDDLIGNMKSSAMDECGEVAEEYLNDLTEDKKDDLKKHISNWFYVNAKLNFYGVENQHKIVVMVE